MEDNPLPIDESSALVCDLSGVNPNDVVGEINSTQCENLSASNGLDGTKRDNCEDLSEMMCLIKQEVDAIATERAMVIAANDASKCQDDTDPTLASFWSRVLRWSQAVTCILCEYDPFVATILKQGRYPQILMGAVQVGADGSGYPQWVMPDEVPTEWSPRPVMSSGVVKAVNEAILSVWHLWEEHPEFTYFAQTYNDPDNPQNLLRQTQDNPPAVGDTALVGTNGSEHNITYTWNGNAWTNATVIGEDEGLTNFAVTHILKGYYADKGVYYFHDGTEDTWNVMDVELGDIEKRLDKLEKIFENAVVSATEGQQFILTTAESVNAANSVACTEGKTTIVLITG